MTELLTVLMISVPALFGAGWVAMVIRNRRQEARFRTNARL